MLMPLLNVCSPRELIRSWVDIHIVVHQSCHQRPCRPLLDDRLIVGSGIGELLAVEQIVPVSDNSGSHESGQLLDGKNEKYSPDSYFYLFQEV